MESESSSALTWELHQSMQEYAPVLQEYFSSMLDMGKWYVLPYSVSKEMLGMQLSPPWFQGGVGQAVAVTRQSYILN